MIAYLRKIKADSNFKTHGRIRMNICVVCGNHLSQFSSQPCSTVRPRYKGEFRRRLWAKCFVFSAKRLAYIRNESEYGEGHINWLGVADYFDTLYWNQMQHVPK